MWKWLLVLAVATGCGFPRPADVKNQVAVGGIVHGMWTGADGVALRLTADGIDTLYSATANGAFSFPTTISEGASYVVSLASNPTMHLCTISRGKGVAGPVNVSSIDVACTGPSVSIAASSPAPWIFDPTQDAQPTLAASLLLQDITLTISSPSGLVTSAQVAHIPVAIGSPSPPQKLGLGVTKIDVDITAQGGLSKTYELVVNRGSEMIAQMAYGKASNTGSNDRFATVALSGDTLVVGAPFESSSASGINGDQSNDIAQQAGAVYVFRRTGIKWTQEAYIKASNPDMGDRFGTSVALVGDILAVGAPGEASGATGVNGDQLDNHVTQAGAVYVFQRVGTIWVQQAYIKASNTALNDVFGTSVALSEDTLVVGANNEASAGAAYVFQRTGTSWTQQAYLRPSNPSTCVSFGESVTISGDTLAVGAPYEPSGATGVNGNQSDSSAVYAGAVYVFQRTGSSWVQQAYVKASNTGAVDAFGWSVALSGDTLAVGAQGEASKATGINGNQADNSAPYAGAVYVFQRSAGAWSQQAYLKASNTDTRDNFGSAVVLYNDLLAVGASSESSAAAGVDGNQLDNSAPSAGAVYVFQRVGAVWAQQAYIKASNIDTPTLPGDSFGISVALSGDTLAVGAVNEDSSARGFDGNQADNGAPDSGAIYIFR